MVYSASDIKHLEIMDSLDKSDPIEPDEVIVSKAESFDENILKLCEGLRSNDLGKQADAIETKFLNYKAAAKTHLYRAHDEDGEDLINAAHPDGDPNMGDGEHGDVETILSRHKKMVDIVQKQPNGKLGAYINQCKVALGIDPKNLSNVSDEEASFFLSVSRELKDEVNSIIKSLDTEKYANIYVNGQRLKTHLESLDDQVSPGWAGGGLTGVINESLRGKVFKLLNDTLDLMKAIRDTYEQNPNAGFDNPKFATTHIARLMNIREHWFTYWNRFVTKDEEAAKFHEKFLTTEQVGEISDGIIEKFNRLNSFIKNTLLTDETVNKYKPVVDHFKYLSDYLSSGMMSFDKLKKDVIAFETGAVRSLKESSSEITINVMKKTFDTLKELGGPAMKDFCGDLNLSSVDALKQSTDKISQSVIDSIKTIFESWKQLAEVKDVAISRIPR